MYRSVLQVLGLSELYHVGQPLRCKVIECDTLEENKKGKWKPKLTVNPKDVNQNLTSASLKSDVVRRPFSLIRNNICGFPSVRVLTKQIM